MELNYSLYIMLNGESTLIATSCMKHDLAFLMNHYRKAWVTDENDQIIFEKDA